MNMRGGKSFFFLKKSSLSTLAQAGNTSKVRDVILMTGAVYIEATQVAWEYIAERKSTSP